MVVCAGFEKMDHGLAENFTDRVSPIEGHVNHLKDLGVESGPLNPHVNSVTSDVVKVKFSSECIVWCIMHTCLFDLIMHG